MSFDAQQVETQAAQYLSQGRVEDALKSYKSLLRKDPKSRRLRKTVADLSLKLGNKREAEQLMLTIAETDVKEKQYRMAIPIYRELIKMRPKDYEMHLEIAHCLISSNFETDALIHLKKAVEMTQRQKPEIAQEIQYRIVEMTPGELTERRTYAELLESANWSDKASDAWKDFAALNRKLGKIKEAARSIERALNNRENWETRLEAAQCRFESQEPRKALEHLQMVYKDYPTDPKVLALLATGLQMVGHEAKAKQLWLEAGKRYEDAVKKAAAYTEATTCGATSEDLPEDIEGIQRLSVAHQIRLHMKDWASSASKVEHRFVLKTSLYMEFGRFEDALDCIVAAEGLEKRPAIFALLTEALVANDKVEEAIEILQGFKNSSDEIMEDVQLRLLGLGLSEEDSEELIDDDLLDDDLEDLSEDISDDNEGDQEGEDEQIEATPVGSDVDALIGTADELFSTGQVKAALDVLNQVLEKDPTHMGALQKMGSWALQETTAPVSFQSSSADSFAADPFASTDPFASNDPFKSGGFPTPSLTPTIDAPTFDANESSQHTAVATSLLMRPELRQVYKYMLIGFMEEAIQELRSLNTLEAAIVLARIRISKGEYRGALEDVQDALDNSTSQAPAYLDALWEVARIYSLQQRVRNTKRTLDEIVDVNPDYKRDEVMLWKEALELLD